MARPPGQTPTPQRTATWGIVVLLAILFAIIGGLIWVFWYAFVGSVATAPPPPAPLVGQAAEDAGRADAVTWLEVANNCGGVWYNSVVHRYYAKSEALFSVAPGQEYGREYMAAWVTECAARLPEKLHH